MGRVRYAYRMPPVSTHNSEPLRPRNRSRLHHVYFVLAAFDLVCVGLSLFTISRISGIYTESVAVNQQWANRLQDYRELSTLASDANAPGNDVFVSRDFDAESARFDTALRAFNEKTGEVRDDLKSMAPEHVESPQLLAGLDAVDTAMTDMQTETLAIFGHLRAGQVDQASTRMAAMDRAYASVISRLSDLGEQVGAIQKRMFDEQTAQARFLRRMESVIVCLIVLMVVGITVYGRKLALRMVESENQVRELNEQLEERVRERTAELSTANEELSERKERLRAIFDTADCAIMTFDDAGVVESLNQAGQQLFQRSAEDVVGQNVTLLTGPPPGTDRQIDLTTVARSDELTGVRSDGTTFPFQLFITEVPLPSGRLFTGIIHDLTIEKRAMQAERLASIGQLVTGISHESRNALQRIQMGLDNLSFELNDNESFPGAKEELNLVAKSTKDLVRLFEDLRSYAAPIKLSLTSSDLRSVWQKAWSSLQTERKGRQAELIDDTGDLDLTCRIDSFRIEQVFRNLMENALAACDDPVQLRIQCHAAELDGKPAVRVHLRDNGPGLSPEQQARIFEAFFTTKRKGTGLGMAIVHRIIDEHGATITAGNANPAGAEFVMTFLSNRA